MGRTKRGRLTLGGLERDVGSSKRSGTGRGILRVVQDGSGDCRGVPGRVGGPFLKSGTGRGTIREVRDVSGNHRGG